MTSPRLLTTRAALAMSLVIAQATLGAWYADRASDGGDEFLCVLALIGLVFAVQRTTWFTAATRADWVGIAVLLPVLFAATWFLRPLVATSATLLSIVWLTRSQAGWGGRMLLALAAVPSGASVQFYLGFPLRRLTTEASASILNVFGASVEAEGTVLRGPYGPVAVDAACSGAHSLWVALAVVGAVSAWRGLSLGRTALLGGIALLAVLFANALRASLLYPFLINAWPEFPGYHSGVGLLCFAFWFWPWANHALTQKGRTV